MAHVPTHGFTRACLLEAVSHTSLPLSAQSLDGLFPSSAHDGPIVALLHHWSQSQTAATISHVNSIPSATLLDAFDHRLGLNEPLKFRLRGAWGHRILGLALPDLKAFTSHAATTSSQILTALEQLRPSQGPTQPVVRVSTYAMSKCEHQLTCLCTV